MSKEGVIHSAGEPVCVPKKGDWVVVVSNKVIACDRSAKNIMPIADKYPDKAIITKEPTSNNCYYY